MNDEKVGLLPLYLKLYDDTVPSMRPRVEHFLSSIQHALEQEGLSIVSAPICRSNRNFARRSISSKQAALPQS